MRCGIGCWNCRSRIRSNRWCGRATIPLETYMTQANPSSESESTSPLSANLPHRPADDTEEVYYEGSPVLRGAIFKGFLWILVGLLLIAAPIVAKIVFHQSV